MCSFHLYSPVKIKEKYIGKAIENILSETATTYLDAFKFDDFFHSVCYGQSVVFSPTANVSCNTIEIKTNYLFKIRPSVLGVTTFWYQITKLLKSLTCIYQIYNYRLLSLYCFAQASSTNSEKEPVYMSQYEFNNPFLLCALEFLLLFMKKK